MAPGAWNENVLDYFLNTNQIKTRDGAEIIWYHAANNKSQMKEAIQSAAHMVEADILLCGEEEGNGEPIMAHPPETKSDNTLQAWLNEIVNTKKGIKLDFKSLAAVKPSMMLLEGIKLHQRQPVWINADILPGPNGSNTVVDAKRFLDTVTSFCPDVTLSLGWTTGWQPQQCNKGYSWAMVKEMAQICDALTQPVTFPVRAALVRQSKSELVWLLQKSNRYSLTVWTGRHDKYSIEDLLYLRENFDKKSLCTVYGPSALSRISVIFSLLLLLCSPFSAAVFCSALLLTHTPTLKPVNSLPYILFLIFSNWLLSLSASN
ncbi:hypothetical protein KIL84_013361 [Mauremys mutica]|uniref:Menorin-like domain-containing protein n=1 Tax=Mauremys mutica TaxID=74926 RepID=A0A9D3WVR8_9SAUR|nr:hypothetical protein KIL84_013361 [Mauremys mutica]